MRFVEKHTVVQELLSRWHPSDVSFFPPLFFKSLSFDMLKRDRKQRRHHAGVGLQLLIAEFNGYIEIVGGLNGKVQVNKALAVDDSRVCF